jgi:hypothetical protein
LSCASTVTGIVHEQTANNTISANASWSHDFFQMITLMEIVDGKTKGETKLSQKSL